MNKLTFIDIFSIDELKIVEEDIREYYNNIKSLYVIDTFDIINYTLPFVNNASLRNDFKYTFSTIFYEGIFTRFENIDIILANEYKQELSNIADSFEERIYNFKHIRNRLLESIDKSINVDEIELQKEVFYKDLELIIVLLIFIEKGENLFDRFNQFIDRVSVDYFKTNDTALSEKINLIFRETNRTDLTNSIFDQFIDNHKLKIASIESDYKRYCYLDNTYRDISVIDRIFNINKKLDKHIKIKYLSSTPWKTKTIISILKSKESGFTDFNRNINQVYLLKTIVKNSNNIQDALENIDLLINFKKLENNAPVFELEGSILRSIQNSIRIIKKDLSNSYFFDSFIFYEERIKEKFESGKLTRDSLVELRSFIEKIDAELSIRLIKNRLSSKLKLNQVLSLSHNLSEKLKPSNIFINTGNDIIRNTFHHLPYMIFCEFQDYEYLKKFYNFLNSVSNLSSLIETTSSEFEDDINAIIKDLSIKKLSLDKQIIDFTILIYLNIITEATDNKKNELEIIEIIKSELSILENSKLKFKHDNNKVELIKETDKHIIDFHYMLIWLYRRSNQFEKGKEVFNLDESYKNIPRFVHGLGLIFHSEAYSYLNEKNYTISLDCFDKSKNELVKAFDLYNNAEASNEIFSVLKTKQLVGILNTIIDANLRTFEINEIVNDKLLTESREYFNLLSQIIIDELPCIRYESLETINHTETELIYYEALHLFKKNEYIESLIKLNFTVDKLNIISKSENLVIDRFKTIGNKINELRYKNFEKLNLV